MSSEVDLPIPGFVGARQVGEGGFGRVYVARQPSLERDVAVKVLEAHVTDDLARSRFERECAALGKLSGHPNIVALHEAGFDGRDRPYLVMGYMDQGSYGDRLQERGRLPWSEVVDVGVRVAGAVETAHRAGILHRDLKPENILISAYGEPTLADFGIARLQGGPQTASGKVTTSIAHAAPEVFDQAAPTPAWDVYALGSTMFTLLAGRYAFVRETDEGLLQVLGRIAREPLPDLRGEGVPDAVARVVERAMAKDARERYPSALAVARALQDAQRSLGTPVTPTVVPGEPPIVEPGTGVADGATRTIQGFAAAGAPAALPTAPPGWEAGTPPTGWQSGTPPPGWEGSDGWTGGSGAWTPAPAPRNRRTGLLVGVVVGVAVLIGGGVALLLLLGGGGGDAGRGGGPARVGFGERVAGAIAVSGQSVEHRFDGRAGQGVQIDLVSPDGDLDPLLRLIGPGGAQLGRDDDGGDGLDARLTTTLPSDGTYIIVAAGFSESTGAYELTITGAG